MIRLESDIGGKRVPLWYEWQGPLIAVTSQCMQVSPSAPIQVEADEDCGEVLAALERAGYWRVEIVEVAP